MNEENITVINYDPLNRNTFTALAVNAVGRGSEVENLNAFTLAHSTGNSGKSIGFLQTDLGQRPAVVTELLNNYQNWASDPSNGHSQFTQAEITSLTQRLRTSGQSGNGLSEQEADKLNAFLSSNTGRNFVSILDDRQATRLWENVGEPLSNVEWMRQLREDNPEEATIIIARAMKLFNQNETRGERLITYLSEEREVPLSSNEVREWILNNPTLGLGINGLNQSARNAITSGQNKVAEAAELFHEVISSDGNVGSLFRNTINDNPHLIPTNNSDAEMLLLDKIFRNSNDNSRLIVDIIDNDLDNNGRKLFRGTDESSRIEINGENINLRDLNGINHNVIELLDNNLNRQNTPQDPISLNTGNEAVNLLLANLKNSKDDQNGFDLDVMLTTLETKEGKEFTANIDKGVESLKVAEASIESDIQPPTKSKGVGIV